MWQERVEKVLTTAVKQGHEVHAYAIFDPAAKASKDERGHILAAVEPMFPTVNFHFTHIDQL